MVADRLAALGATLSACDPHIPHTLQSGLPVEFVDFGPEALAKCDLAILLVDHPEFDPATICEHSPLTFDTKGVLRGQLIAGEIL